MANFTLTTAWSRFRAYHAKLTDALLADCNNIKHYNKYVTLEKNKGYFVTFGAETRSNESDVLLSVMVFDQDGVILFNDVRNLMRTPWNWVRMGEVQRERMLKHVVTNMCYGAGVPLDPNEPFTQVEEDVYALNVSWTDYEIFLGYLLAAEPQMKLQERINAHGSL